VEDLNWPLPEFEEVFIHEAVWESDISKRVREIFPANILKVKERPYQDKEGALSGSDFSKSKRRLYLSKHEGHFFRKCPGTQGAACCNYFVLNLGVQCNMNCSYCYLQSYINSPVSQIYTNIEDAFRELDEITLKYPKSPFRVGTGETIDSLTNDDLTLYSIQLVEWFSRHPNLTCEFKTKSSNIKNFINLPHGGNVVVSFSINPEVIVSSEEHGTATLAKRLWAAKEAVNRGFPVAFHIDPMIYVEGWQNFYTELVEQVTEIFKPKDVKWISVGALRYPPSMKHMLRERFESPSKILTGELFLSQDGKLRYDQALRTQMFNHVISEFHKRDRKYPVFLCMEAPESWIGTFEHTPRNVPSISELFRPLQGPN
jgi:spore photoproduct lyase